MKEKGFTLVELLAVTAIITIIALGATVSIFHIFRVSAQNNDISTAVRQAQNVGYWISHDALMAENIAATSPPVIGAAVITMGWNQRETGNTCEVSYTWLSSGNSLYKIKRSYTVRDKEGNLLTNRTALIADNIDSLNYTQQADGTCRLTVVTRSGKQSVTREYQTFPRINA